MLSEPDSTCSSTDNEWVLAPFSSPIDLNPFHADKLNKCKFDHNQLISVIKKTACAAFHPDFVEIMDRVDMSDEQTKDAIKKKIIEMRVAVHSKCRNKSSTASAGSMSSLPSIEKHNNRKRLAPPSSPSSNKKR